MDIFKLKDEFIAEVLAPTTGIDFGLSNSIGGFELILCDHNEHYKSSPFYYDEQTDFLHFTSAENLLKIIKTNSLRLYRFLNRPDMENYDFAQEALGIQNINQAKYNTFILSMCELQDEYNSGSWNLYADNSKGVAVKLSFSNDLEKWGMFHLSKVFYKKDKQFDTYQELLKEFQKKYSMPWFNVDFSRFAGFYKKTQYSKENEVRLLCYHRQVVTALPPPRNTIQFDENGNQYVKIELFNDSTNVTRHNEWKPKPKISEIILGANFNNQQVIEEIKELMPNVIVRKSKIDSI